LSFLVEENFSLDNIKLGLKPKYDLRIIGLFLICTVLLGFLGLRLWYLQVYKYGHYKQRSEENRLRIIPISPNRGLIFDRNGKVLVDNRTSYSVFIYPVKITPEIESKINSLAKTLNIEPKQIINKIKYAGANSPYPIDIKQDIDQETISFLLENRFSFPAITIEHSITRTHPEKTLASHILGYTGEISYEELHSLTDKNYKVGNNIGKTGIENAYEDILRGKEGGHFIEVDAIGRKIRTLNTEPPEQGNNIRLTIDLNLQKKMESMLEGKKGAAVVMDVNTGEILAMASKPDFDPNMFYSKITKKEWDRIQKLENPFLNRALNPYTPGSIFKPITSIAALEIGILSSERQFYSKGYFTLGGYRFNDWNPHGFGWVNIEKALAYSIDTVYYELSLEMGINNIKRYANMFGFGNKTGINLPGERKGTIPDQAFKQKYWHEMWYPGDSVNSSIGQGFVQVTPLQATVMTAAFANGGKVLKPQILNSENGKPGIVKPEIKKVLKISEKNMQIVRNGLRAAISYGTGTALKFPDLEVAGKTGSAEDPPNKKTHGWIISYAPYKSPKYAVTVFLQNGGHGGNVAAPIARELYLELFKNHKK
jgi:penicillin-binding protein 2